MGIGGTVTRTHDIPIPAQQVQVSVQVLTRGSGSVHEYTLEVRI